MLDIKITQGEYWGGAQISYWVYLALAIFPLTGLLGLDHMALRSPMTAVLKFLSIIPLLGFWYFYDIAQLLGERKLVEKNGLAVPFYGPIGLGAGMFSGSEGIKQAPKDSPSPWLYLVYAFTTCVFIALPINKFVIGDYMGGLSQLLMYICIFTIITPFLAIAWGFYDIYKVLFKTRDIIEQGPERFIPANWFIQSKFNRNVLGPLPPLPEEPDTWFKRLMAAWFELPISTLKAVSTAEKVSSTIISSAAEAATQPITNATKVATNTVAAAGQASKAVTGTVEKGATAMEGIAGLLEKIPQIGEKIATNLGDKVINAAKITKGGGSLEEPSVSSALLLFGVGFMAFTGFVFYFMRKTYRKPENSDDPPSESSTI
jgi:hypothetical protein